MLEKYWIKCPICNGKTRVQVFYNTVLRNFPLFCPKCASYGKTGQLLRVSGAAVPFRTVRSTAMLARSATGEVNTVIYLYPAC